MTAADVKEFFDQIAGEWDTMRLDYYDERVIEQLAANTRLTGEQTVVDVGTGTGFVAAGLAAHARRVIGYDNAVGMLEVARTNLDRLGIDNVELGPARRRGRSAGFRGCRPPGLVTSVRRSSTTRRTPPAARLVRSPSVG